MSSTQPRRPAGVPTGGQFAAKSQPAPGYTLDDGPATIDGEPVEPETTVSVSGARAERYRRNGVLHDPDDGRPAVVWYRPDGTVEYEAHYRNNEFYEPADEAGPAGDAKVSFSPEAIRAHFGAMGSSTEDLTDEQLRSVAEDALEDDRLWDAYHRALDAAVRRVREGRAGDHVWARGLPNYTEVSAEFSIMPGRRFRLMARGMPAGPGDRNPRRFTNLDTGMELWVPADGKGADGRPMFSHIEIADPR